MLMFLKIKISKLSNGELQKESVIPYFLEQAPSQDPQISALSLGQNIKQAPSNKRPASPLHLHFL